MGPFVERKGWGGVFLKDMGQSIGFYWVLAQVRAPPAGPSSRHVSHPCGTVRNAAGVA